MRSNTGRPQDGSWGLRGNPIKRKVKIQVERTFQTSAKLLACPCTFRSSLPSCAVELAPKRTPVCRVPKAEGKTIKPAETSGTHTYHRGCFCSRLSCNEEQKKAIQNEFASCPELLSGPCRMAIYQLPYSVALMDVFLHGFKIPCNMCAWAVVTREMHDALLTSHPPRLFPRPES